MYATGGVANMEEAWLDFPSVGALFRPSLRDNLFTGLSLFSMERFSKRLEEHMDFGAVHRSALELSFILLNVSRGEGQFFSNHKARSPAELRKMSTAGRQAYLDGRAAERQKIQQQIDELLAARKDYVAKETRELIASGKGSAFDLHVAAMLREQARRKGITIGGL